MKNQIGIIGSIVALLGAPALAQDRSAHVGFRAEDGKVIVTVDNQPVATYVYADANIHRPYFAHVKAPGGHQVTRNHPPVEGKDRTDHDTMHPGIWMAFGDLAGSDFWRNRAQIMHESFLGEPAGGAGHGSFTERKHYLRADGTLVCKEEFRCSFHVLQHGYLLTWDSTFFGDDEFYFGDQEEMGLGLRVTTPISEIRGGQLRDSEGRKGAKEIWSHAAAWCDYRGVVDGQWIGMTLMCHPDNFRESWMHARDYGFVAANPFGRQAMRKGPPSRVVVKPGERLRLRYGIWIHDGTSGEEPDCAAAYAEYLKIAAARRAAAPPKVHRHVVVYGEQGRFAGWPANHGMWMWGNEILVGFSTGIHKDLGEELHNIDREKPEHHVLARSLDGGETWKMEYPADRGMLINDGGMRHGTTDPKQTESPPVAITQPLDFTHPDFCMTMRFHDIHGGASRLYYSYDRGHQWKGPYRLPTFGQPAVMARTDYIVNSPLDCHVFLTASKRNRQEGRVFCGRTTDGGVTWNFLSYVGPEPHGFSIMPSTVRLSESRLVMATRRREGPGERRHRWIDTWESYDNGQSWKFVNDAVADVGEGNPPAMIRLQDGRLCLTYGVRKPPFEMRAQFSNDGGHTWTDPFVLQTGGGGRDMGYARTLQRPDGKVVTLYYFYTPDNIYRRILATIWDPGS